MLHFHLKTEKCERAPIPQPAKRVYLIYSKGAKKEMTETIPFSFPPGTRTVVAVVIDFVVPTLVLVVIERLVVDAGRVETVMETMK